MPGYVAKQWTVEQQPNERGNYVEIVARPPGITSWLLGLMGIDATTSLFIDDQNFILEKGSLAGRVREVVPLGKISATTYGFVKPWKEALALSVVLLVPTFGISLIIGLVYYFMFKTLTIGIKASGGVAVELDLKNKGLGGNKLTDKHAAEVSHVTQMLIDQIHGSAKKRPARQLSTELPKPGNANRQSESQQAPAMPVDM